jgi:hypothetical protein
MQQRRRWVSYNKIYSKSNHSRKVDEQGIDHGQPRMQDDVLMSLEMKLSCKCRWGSFLNQDGWCITDKQEEQLFTMPLEDKDNQGGTQVCISNKHQFINQESLNIKKGWRKKNMQLSASLSPGSDSPKKSKMQGRGLARQT